MSRPLSFLQELRVVREINASLPFADPITRSGVPTSPVRFKAEFYPPELYMYDPDLNVPIGAW
jgi:hypothetical protein